MLSHRDLMMKFESLGGSGDGPDFAICQQHSGIEPDGLLAWADLGNELLAAALESRLEGVGLPENTTVFAPEHSDEWWTKDTRWCMAMRSFLKLDRVPLEHATAQVCERFQARRQRLVSDLQSGDKIFVFKNLQRNPTVQELARIHAAIRSYGDSTLFYVGYADASHPPGTVEAAAPGLLIGHMDHSIFASDSQPAGRSDGAWLALCQRAAECHASANQRTPPPAPEAEPTPPAPPAKHRAKPRRGRQIVLIGNCQMQAMAALYKRFVAPRSHDVLEHVPSHQDLSEDNRTAIQQADLVVEQLFDLKPPAATDAVPATTPRLFIPMVTASFLWPFADSPHPKNTFHPFLTSGPYGAEAADSFLNRLILAGTDPEAAVETYASLDVNDRVNLDRLFEIVIEMQQSRDAASGYQIAGLMQQHFRSEQIFLSPCHPNVRIATALAARFFEQLGAERDEIERMQECTRITPFPKGELPFHPSVCRHFGLDFVKPDRRYRFMNEGFFTFREYVLRYMRYQWNDALEEGIYLSQNGKMTEARERLTVAAQRSPLSAAAHDALGGVLSNQGARDDAIIAMRQAVALEPDAASYHANLGNLLRQAHHLDDALLELRCAVSADPGEPHYRVLLAHLLRQRGEHAAACDTVLEAIRLDPCSAGLRAELAASLEAKGDLNAAVVALHHAVAMAPADVGSLARLAQLLGRVDRLDEAIDAARSAVALAPDTAPPRIALSEILLRKGNQADALIEAYSAAVVEPGSGHAYGHLGHLLDLTGDLPAAEVAFRRAAKIDPHHAHYRHEISSVLHRQHRLDAAIEAAREAATLEPRNPHRCVHLASLLTQSGNLAEAQAEQRKAVDIEPGFASFRVTLSDLLARNGQTAEALAEARIAVDYNPDSALCLGQLAQVCEITGAYDEARQTLQRALEIEPENATLLRRMTSLQTRGGPVLAV
jgi:tetratricopeptide (TPR) repeat protein